MLKMCFLKLLRKFIKISKMESKLLSLQDVSVVVYRVKHTIYTAGAFCFLYKDYNYPRLS